MVTTVKTYPTFEIEIIREDTTYHILDNTYKTLKQNDFEQAIQSFSVKNSMEDDTPVFSLGVLGKDKWDKVISTNDLIRIKVIPDVAKPMPDNPYIMVGLISEIHKEGEYDNGTLLYRITGRAMTKALIDFEVGVIREVTMYSSNIGWLPDGDEKGLNFSGSTAADIGSQLMERFIYKYARYRFDGERGLKDFLKYGFSSWDEYEALADVTPFINYEGSLRQFLEDITAKPFNELFFEYTPKGECQAVMRPTPFDRNKWRNLPAIKITSDLVAEESFGRSDKEMYSVYFVQAPNLMELNSVDLGVFPKYHPELIDKYGYKRLEAQNRYLMTPGMGSDNATSTGEFNPTNMPNYDDVRNFLDRKSYLSPEKIRSSKSQVRSAIFKEFPKMTQTLVNGVMDSIVDGTFTREEYNKMRDNAYDSGSEGESNYEKSQATEKLDLFTRKLYNWYCENSNFYAGDIRVLGDPRYRIGSKLLYKDEEQKTTWEFYIESIQHEFTYTSGYTTIIGVTRGLPDNGKRRFNNLWGKSKDFEGGYLGEPSLEELKEMAEQANSVIDPEAPSQWGMAGPSSDIAMAALQTAKQVEQRPSKYVFGGGRGTDNPFYQNPIVVDCSSFVWWCYYTNGINLNGGRTGMTTDTIKVDKRFKTVSKYGSSKTVAQNTLKLGDLVYFDTYKTDGHLGIYSGNGKFIGAQTNVGIAEEDMTSGYWWKHFNGRVLRYSIMG